MMPGCRHHSAWCTSRAPRVACTRVAGILFNLHLEASLELRSAFDEFLGYQVSKARHSNVIRYVLLSRTSSAWIEHPFYCTVIAEMHPGHQGGRHLCAHHHEAFEEFEGIV